MQMLTSGLRQQGEDTGGRFLQPGLTCLAIPILLIKAGRCLVLIKTLGCQVCVLKGLLAHPEACLRSSKRASPRNIPAYSGLFQSLPHEPTHFPAQTFRVGRISLPLFRGDRNSAQEVEMTCLNHITGCTWLSRRSFFWPHSPHVEVPRPGTETALLL